MRFSQILVGKNRYLEILAVFGAIAILLMFNWRILVTQELMARHDTLSSYGQFYYLADSISHGIFPYWNPYMNAGEPNFISLNAGNFLSPVILGWILLAIFFKLSFLTAWHWIFFTYFIIFALGCYFLFRRILDYKVSAYIAFITILFSSLSTIFWQQWGFIYIVYTLPWVLFFTLEVFDHHRIYSLIPLSFFLGISLISVFSVYFIFFYLVFIIFLFLTGALAGFKWSIFKENKRIWGLAILIFLAITMQLLPIFLYRNDIIPTLRMETTPSVIAKDIRPSFDGMGGTPSTMFDFTALLVPNFFLNFYKNRMFWPNSQESAMYIGVVSLVFLLIGVFYGRHRYKLAAILTAMVVMFLMLGKKSFVLQFAYYFFPGFSLIRNMEFFMPYLIFLLVFLVGVGMDRVVDNFYKNELDQLKKYLKLSTVLGFLYLILSSTLIFVIYFLLRPRLQSIVVSEPLGTRTIEDISWSLNLLFESSWHVLFFIVATIFFFHILKSPKIEFRNKILVLTFLIIFELLSLDHILMPHVTQVRQTHVPQYSTPIKYEDFRLARMENDKIFAWYGPALFKKFTAYMDKFPTGTHFVEMKDFYEFKNSNISDKIKDALLGISFSKLRLFDKATVNSPEQVINSIVDYPSYGKIEVTGFDPNRLNLKILADQDSILYYSDGYDKYWQAYIDGQKTKIYKTGVAFKSIILPAGEHRVEFAYNPFLFRISLYFYLTTIALGLFWCMYWLIKKASSF